MTFTPELGQATFSNGVARQYDLTALGEECLCVLARAITAVRGQDEGCGSLVSNSGDEPYESDVFSMRAYCWCDGGIAGHEEGCPPNFEFHPTGLGVSWYKHVGRSASMDNRVLPHEWFRVLRSCLADVLGE